MNTKNNDLIKLTTGHHVEAGLVNTVKFIIEQQLRLFSNPDTALTVRDIFGKDWRRVTPKEARLVGRIVSYLVSTEQLPLERCAELRSMSVQYRLRPQ